MSQSGEDSAELKPAGQPRTGHRRHRHKPAAPAPDIALPHEMRRSNWTRRDTWMLLVATVELCFLPHTLITLLIPLARRGLGFESVPFGLTLASLLGGTLLAFILFVLLCYLIRKHIYQAALTIMVAVLVFELVSFPVAHWVTGLNQQQRGHAGAKSSPASPAP